VFELLGLEDGKAFNGWSTAGTLAWMCGTTERSVQRSLDKLKKLGLVKTTGTRGYKGRTVLHVPGVVGAAQNLARRKLSGKPPTEDDEAPAQIRRRCRIPSETNTTQLSPRIRPARRMNPLKSPINGYEPSERAPGDAASRPGEPLSKSGLGEEEGACGQEDEADALTLPRTRLKRRLAGMAKKAGLQDGGEGLLQASDQDTVKRWMRMQSDEEARKRQGKRAGPQLFKALTQALADHYRLNDRQIGRKLAAEVEPEPAPPPEPRRAPPPPPASPPPPSPPWSSAWRARAGGNMAAAIHEPEHKPEPRKPYTCSADDLRASAERLKRFV
jgi:hypothetical protein